jgi:hypothetical protein
MVIVIQEDLVYYIHDEVHFGNNVDGKTNAMSLMRYSEMVIDKNTFEIVKTRDLKLM